MAVAPGGQKLHLVCGRDNPAAAWRVPDHQTTRSVIADVGVERPTVASSLSISTVIRIVICVPKILSFRIKSPDVVTVYSGPFPGQGQAAQKHAE